MTDPFRPPRDHIEVRRVDSPESLAARIVRWIIAVVELLLGAVIVLGAVIDTSPMGTGARVFGVTLTISALILPAVALARRVKGCWWFQFLPALGALMVIAGLFLSVEGW